MSVNIQHKIRLDLLEMYERLTRYTSLRARTMPEAMDVIIVTESDYATVNPLMRLALGRLSDDIGSLSAFDLSGLDALTASGLEDWKLKIVEGAEDLSKVIAIYNLPGEQQEGYVSAVHEFMYEAVVNEVLSRWYKHLGFYDLAALCEQDYLQGVRQIRNTTPRWKTASSTRRFVGL